jgi:hypothetical protein
MSQSADELRVSAAKTQSLFREVNERIETLRPSSTNVRFACECALSECIEFVDITPEEYGSVRQHPDRFFVRPGHANLEVEEVVESDSRYDIVRKLGVGADLAAQLDPRGKRRADGGAT